MENLEASKELLNSVATLGIIIINSVATTTATGNNSIEKYRSNLQPSKTSIPCRANFNEAEQQ